MTHRRKEVALQPIGFLHFAISLLQFGIDNGQIARPLFQALIQNFNLLFSGFPICNIADHADNARTVFTVERAEIDVHSEFRPVGTQCPQI